MFECLSANGDSQRVKMSESIDIPDSNGRGVCGFGLFHHASQYGIGLFLRYFVSFECDSDVPLDHGWCDF